MPKVKISEYSATANSNTDVASINIDEGCAPSGINNAIRAVMGHLKDFQQGTYGDPFNGPVNGTVGATTPSTGAFTTLSASGIITSTATAGQVVKAESGTTGILYSNFANTGGTFLYGIDNSAGTALFSGSAAYAGFIGTSGARPLVLATNGAGRAFIDSSGNVGIGTSSPVAKLQIKGSGTSGQVTSSFILENDSSGTLGMDITGTAGSSYWRLLYGGGPSTGTNTLSLGMSMVIEGASAGNVGIGTSSPQAKLEAYQSSSGSTAQVLRLANPNTAANTGAGIQWNLSSSNTVINGEISVYRDAATSGTMVFKNAYATGGALTESMRIDSSGNLLVGTQTSASSRLCLEYTGASLLGQNINDSDNTNNSTFVQFQIQGTQVGTIKRVGTTSAVIYNTTSDYRLKTVTGAVTGQGDRIDALKPIVFQWKEGGQQAKGFLAHEFQEVYASSVSGDKDAVDTNGKPVYQAMQASTSEVIADLVAEIQSLRKRLAALESA